MSHWGKRIATPIFDKHHKVDNIQKINYITAHKTNCNSNNECNIFYIYNNGQQIFTEIDKFNTIPKSIQDEKISILFNTNNKLKQNLFTNKVLDYIKQQTYNSSDDVIINHMLFILKPYIQKNNLDNLDYDSLITQIIETLKFKLDYMNNLESQLNFLLNNDTIQFIKDKIIENVKDKSVPTDDFIIKMLKHEINNFKGQKQTMKNKMTTDNISDIYINGLGILTEKNIFTIIHDTIARITTNITIENQMIKNNRKLDRWDTVLGDNNKHGIRQYTTVKVNNRKPPGMLFNMTY